MYLPTLIRGPFDRQYIIDKLRYGAATGNPQPEPLWGNTDAARRFVKSLSASDSHWRSLLFSHGDCDLRHTPRHLSQTDLVAELLARGRVYAYPVPSAEQLQTLQALTYTDSNKRRYRLLPASASLTSAFGKEQRCTDAAQASAIAQSLSLDANALSTLWAFLPDSPHSNPSPTERIEQALLNGTLILAEERTRAPAPKAEAEDTADDVLTPKVPSLGPHAEPGYMPPPPAAKPPATGPAQSLEECEQRLSDARERLIASDGVYQPKYTDDELKAMAQTGELDDRFVVRLIETQYAEDSGYLGRPDGAGQVKFWSTTFNQAENADTDPDTLAPLFGFEPDPTAEYTLVVVDTQAPGAGQSLVVVPTHENMSKLSKAEIEGVDPARVDAVMTPEYNAVYAQHMAEFENEKLDIQKEKDIGDYADANFTSGNDKALFKTRATIHKEMGANQYYTGDGTTKNILPASKCRTSSQCGVMETFTLDKNPQTLGALERSGGAKRLAAKRL